MTESSRAPRARAGRIVLVRHGESEWNAAGRFQGHGGTGLSALGRAQAEATGAYLAERAEDVIGIVRSDLPRVAETSRYTEDLLDVPVSVDRRWRELDVGAWTGRTRDEVARDHPEALAAWIRGDEVVPPGGEAVADLRARVAAALDDIRERLADAGGGTVLVFTHGGTVRAAAALATARDGDERARGPVANCSLTVLDVPDPAGTGVPGPLRLLGCNDTAHLTGVTFTELV